MWQQSHGRWPSLMRRKVCLTNYPGGRGTRFSRGMFSFSVFFPFALLFPPQFESTRAELRCLRREFAFELALRITKY